MKLKELYYKPSEQERKDYLDYTLVGYKTPNIKKIQKDLNEGVCWIILGLFMPVLWRIFGLYAAEFGSWMLELPYHTLPFIMGSLIGIGVSIILYVVRLNWNYKIGFKLIGDNFFKYHKQVMQINMLIIFSGMLLLLWITSKQLNDYSYGSELEIIFLIVAIMVLFGMFAISSKEYTEMIRFEIDKRLKNEV